MSSDGEPSSVDVSEILIQYMRETPDWVDTSKVLRRVSTRFYNLVNSLVRTLSLEEASVRDVEKALSSFQHLHRAYLYFRLADNDINDDADDVARLLRAICRQTRLQVLHLHGDIDWDVSVATTRPSPASASSCYIEDSNLAKDCLPLGLRELSLGGEVMETFSHDQAHLLFEQKKWPNLCTLHVSVPEHLLLDDTVYAILARSSRGGSFPVLECLKIDEGLASNANVSCLASGDWTRVTRLQHISGQLDSDCLTLETMQALRMATPALTWLDLSGSVFEKDACKMFGWLKHLTLKECSLDADRISVIATQCSLCHLEYLDLSYNTHFISEEPPHPLLDMRMPLLKELRLDGCGINSERLPYVLLIQESFLDEIRAPALEILSLSDNPLLFSAATNDIDQEAVDTLLRWKWNQPMCLIVDRYYSGIGEMSPEELEALTATIEVKFNRLMIE